MSLVDVACCVQTCVVEKLSSSTVALLHCHGASVAAPQPSREPVFLPSNKLNRTGALATQRVGCSGGNMLARVFNLQTGLKASFEKAD